MQNKFLLSQYKETLGITSTHPCNSKRSSLLPGRGGGGGGWVEDSHMEIVDVLSLYKTPDKHICSVLFCSGTDGDARRKF